MAVAGEHIQLPNGSFAFTKREPIGVVAGIGSFNYPFQMSLWKSAAALACGNTIVFKPSEKTPLSCVLLGEAYTEAGLPPGCYNVLQVGDFVSMIKGHFYIRRLYKMWLPFFICIFYLISELVDFVDVAVLFFFLNVFHLLPRSLLCLFSFSHTNFLISLSLFFLLSITHFNTSLCFFLIVHHLFPYEHLLFFSDLSFSDQSVFVWSHCPPLVSIFCFQLTTAVAGNFLT